MDYTNDNPMPCDYCSGDADDCVADECQCERCVDRATAAAESMRDD